MSRPWPEQARYARGTHRLQTRETPMQQPIIGPGQPSLTAFARLAVTPGPGFTANVAHANAPTISAKRANIKASAA